MATSSVSLLLVLAVVHAAGSHCALKKTCATCIQEPSCSWCSDPAWKTSLKRCSEKVQACNETFLFNPANERIDDSNKSVVSSQAAQMAPQHIRLKARVGEPINITVRYARAENPVDLYYLMDLSFSMADDKETLSSLGRNLQQFMSTYTSDLRMGFGSFVDKVIGPYTNTKLAAPCDNCTAPYGFKNHLKLSENAEDFAMEVGRAQVSGNVDDIEGGFDALMQAMVCQQQIGWRSIARRLLVFSTDNGFHMAGDGKLGGIPLANDGECHMDVSGQYTHSLLQDYPSVSHLGHKVREKAINVIFAVTEPQLEAYASLAKTMEGAQVASLTANSSNILELVQEQYKKISSSVEMQHNAPDFVNITFFTSCQNSTTAPSNKCDNLIIGEEVEFHVQVTIKSCPTDPSHWNTDFKISPVGSHEASTIHLEVWCDCPCEHEDDPYYKPEAPECSHNGTYMCGICACDSFHAGQKCECDDDRHVSPDLDANNCHAEGDEYDCSGRGICFCGVCQCDARDDDKEAISGTYCECDNYTCLQNGGRLCAGHGTCECGKCKCDSDWMGEDCSCTTDMDNCRKNGQTCSLNGICKCGQCMCNKGYEGNLCQHQSSLIGPRSECEQLVPCVLCAVHESGPLSTQDCQDNCSVLNIAAVNELQEDNQNVVNCVQLDQNQCRIEYQYFYNETSILAVEALDHLDCPPLLNVASLVGGILGLILALGLIAIMLWKLALMRKDRLEFIKFEKEKQRANFNEGANPLYRQPTSTFKNPTYTGLS